jgi:cbb3-type cytochrome oxidase maturation protein
MYFLPAAKYFCVKYQLMSALFILVIISILVAGFFLGAFIWSVYTDQYNDNDGAAVRMLFDNETQIKNK